MKRASNFPQSLSILAAFLCAVAARAYDEPPVNLGLTSFLDGGPPAGPGWYFSEYLQYYTADKLAADNGERLKAPVLATGEIKAPSLDAWISLNQFIYQSDQKVLLGGKWGVDLIVPVVWFDLEPKGLPLSDNGVGIGDVLVGPYLQWDPLLGDNGPIFMHRIEFQCIMPTGRYDDDQALNPGSNAFSFNPYWAATWFMMPRWTLSWRLHWLWNDVNDDPSTLHKIIYGARDDVQPGQAIHLNWATEYEVIEKTLRLGINGYYFKQITGTLVDGDHIGNREPFIGYEIGREQVIGIGPGAVFHFSQEDHLFFNMFVEMDARNRTEGQRFVLRYVHHF